MDERNIFETLGQVSSSEAGDIFRNFLRGSVRQMICEVMAAEVDQLCGPKHHPNGSGFIRAGSSSGRFVIEERREELIRPRVRQQDGLDVGTLYIEPGSPWQNAFAESFNSRFRDEFLSLEVFDNLLAAKRLTHQWRLNYNERRPHSSLGYMTPAEFARQCPASVACAPSAEHCRKDQENHVEFNQPVFS